MLQRFKIKSIPMLILSIFAGIVIWFVVIGTINPEMTVHYSNVPVTIQGSTQLYEKFGYTILSGTDYSFDVSFSGSRDSILHLSKDEIEILCDVSNINGSGLNRIQCTVITPYNDIVVENTKDLILTLEIDKVIDKSFTVRYETVGELDSSHMLGTPELGTDTVIVSGPASELSKISYAYVNADISNLTASKTLSLPVNLVDDKGNVAQLTYSQLVTKTVDLYVPIMLVKDVPFSIRLNYGRGLTENEVDVNISPAKVTLIGDPSSLNEIESISLGSVDLNELGEMFTTEKDFVLPSGIKCRSERSSATVTLTVKEIETRSFTLSNIQINGAIEGCEAEVLSESIAVRIKGNKKLLDSLTEEDFSVSISLSTVPAMSGNYICYADVKLLSDLNVELIPAEYEVTILVRNLTPVQPD